MTSYSRHISWNNVIRERFINIHTSQHFKQGELMNKFYVVAVLTLTCALGFGVKAHAQEAEVSVTVPFEFVAGGQILPAGKYIVSRNSIDAHSGITIRGNDNAALMLPIVVDGNPAYHPKLSFVHVGGEYFLSTVEAPQGTYTFRTPRAMAILAQKKDQSSVSSAGGN
jgi:hypothetical protein